MTDAQLAAIAAEALTTTTVDARFSSIAVEALTSIPTGDVVFYLRPELFLNGAWIDVSAHVETRDGVVITRPGGEPGSALEPTTLQLTLRNAPDPVTGVSPWTPDNQLSPYYPFFTRDVLIRYTYTRGANSWTRFLGWVDSIEPDFGDGSPATFTVRVTASDVMSRWARRSMLSEYGERLLWAAGTNPVDYWPMDDAADAVVLRNVGSGVTAKVFAPKSAAKGTLELAAPDSQVLIDGAGTATRGDGNANAPVVMARLQDLPVRRVSAWVRLDADPLGYDDLFTGWTSSGDLIWRFGPYLDPGTGHVEWQFHSDTSTTASPVFAWGTDAPRDDSWRWVSLIFYGSPSNAVGLAVRDKYTPDELVVPGIVTAFDARATDYLVAGGNMSPAARGKQTNTVQATYGGVYVQYTPGPNDAIPASTSQYGAAGELLTARDRAELLEQYGRPYDILTGGLIGWGDTDDTPVMLVPAKGRTLLDLWTEHRDTVGGVVLTQPNGRPRLRVAAQARPATVALTLSVADDLNMGSGGFAWRKREKPTRVTATSPAGSYVAIDSAAEATGLRLDGPDLATAAGTEAVAASAASAVLAGSGRARATAFGLDPRLSVADVWASLMGLLPGDRLQLTDLPAGVFGHTVEDVYAVGWVETYGGDDPLSVQFVFDAVPADDPAEAVWDTARWAMGDGAATITGGTAVGSTGTGTVVITSTSPLTTAAGEYPLDLDWLGERVTVGSAPASATSPQTCTLTARGVGGTVARVHAAGEAVDIYGAARWAR